MKTVPEALAAFVAGTPVPLTVAAPGLGGHPLLMVNAAFERLTGYDAADLIGRDCRLLQGPLTEPEARAAIRHDLRHGAEAQVVITNHRRDGSAFRSFLFLFPLYDAAGVPRLYVGSQCALPVHGRVGALAAHGAALRLGVGELLRAGLGGLRIEAARLEVLDARSLPHIERRSARR
jgi:PAS domain S-box-containing protein